MAPVATHVAEHQTPLLNPQNSYSFHHSYAFCLDIGVFQGGENEGENRTENSPSRSDASAAQVPNSGSVSSLVRRWRDFGVVAETANSAAVNNNNYSISNSTCSTLCDDSSIDGRLVQSSSVDGESDKSSSNVSTTMNQPSSGDIWTWVFSDELMTLN
nr:uncharacterized protein LOC109157187 [Ipomoea trifida]